MAALLAACSHELVVVLPASDGHIGGVVVESGNQKLVLDKPYAAAEPNSGTVKSVVADAKQVDQTFAAALAARPVAPKIYILYFATDSDELSPESLTTLDAVFADFAGRSVAEIVVTGHTDTVGAPEHNDQLSLERANAVAKQFSENFKAHGIKAEAVSTAGRGERELKVPTGDQVAEPQNRRVEITVR
jgi:outer membrane protein OmpA-like peptidoglycan-associated protein